MEQYLVRQLFTDFKKANDSVRREVFCNMIAEYGICTKLILIIKKTKMWLNETYSKVPRTLMIDNLLREEKNICVYKERTEVHYSP